MKKILFYILSIVLAAVSCTNRSFDEDGLSVSIETLRYTSAGGTKVLTVNSETQWSLTVPEDAFWLSPEILSGKGGSVSFRLIADRNDGIVRRANLKFVNKSGGTAAVTVIQANPYGDTGEDVFPDPESGISVEPAKPNADEPCTIFYAPSEEAELYGYDGDIYVHLGVVVDGEWAFVPAAWDENLPKCRMTKVEANKWSLTLEPSVREFFGTGDTPLNKIAMVVRSDDGSYQTRPDQFCSVLDEKFEFVPFDPDPVIFKSLPQKFPLEHGINIHPDPDRDSVTFVLYDKSKSGKRRQYSYLVGDFNNWERNSSSAMYRDEENGVWWLSVGDLDPDTEYRFQYRLGNPSGVDICVSDPYTELVYDQWNDQYIEESTYPGLREFPEGGKALVSAFKINRDVFDWEGYDDYQIPDRNNLVIYELLIREFSARGDLQGIMDNFQYLKNLGITAIELMPIQEFDGNDSWGYNPNHYYALDKAYGTREMYKEFVKLCHKNGIAVIVDVVYNHSTGLNTFAKLYYGTDKTLSDNPWFNVNGTCMFDVFHDWNLENELVKKYIKGSLSYLIDEYKIDGFRFDLTKGFTNNSGMENSYDSDRIAILTDFYNHIHSHDPNAVVILEHLLDVEQKDLGNAGMQLWANCNGVYRSFTQGSNVDLGFVRDEHGAPFGTSVSYMESHDEERLCAYFTGSTSSRGWGICGDMTNWHQTDKDTDWRMTQNGNIYVAKNVKIKEGEKFKLRADNSWDLNYGTTNGTQPTVGVKYTLTEGGSGNDIAVAEGKYDIWFSPQAKALWILEAGSEKPVEPDIDYSAGDRLEYAMRRAGLSAAFFLTVPGPKMIWQFGEIGYDYSILYPSGTEDDRISRKPVPTDAYKNNQYRKALYNVYSYLLRFRNENSDFFSESASSNFQWYVSTSEWPGKYIFGKGSNNRRYMVVGNCSGDYTDISVTSPDASSTWKVYGETSGQTYSGSSFKIGLAGGDFKLLVNF